MRNSKSYFQNFLREHVPDMRRTCKKSTFSQKACEKVHFLLKGMQKSPLSPRKDHFCQKSTPLQIQTWLRAWIRNCVWSNLGLEDVCHLFSLDMKPFLLRDNTGVIYSQEVMCQNANVTTIIKLWLVCSWQEVCANFASHPVDGSFILCHKRTSPLDSGLCISIRLCLLFTRNFPLAHKYFQKVPVQHL